jgi:beta-lactamase class A
MHRRNFVATALAVGAGLVGCRRSAGRPGEGPSADAVDASRSRAIADLERARGGRLGVAALDLATGARVEHRAGERFPFCSTCKTLAVAATLHRVDLGQEHLDRSIAYTAADLLEYAPTARANLERGALTIGELCKAAIEISDNTAGNLLFREAGGLGAINTYLRSIGDPTTRMDRTETELNTATPGDPRDTTTPRAMLDDLQKLLLGDFLTAASRDQLVAWHLGTTTGKARLRAGIPATWKLAHKTGTGGHGATNDIGIAWPPGRAPIAIAVYYVDSPAPDTEREAVIAAVARIACTA